MLTRLSRSRLRAAILVAVALPGLAGCGSAAVPSRRSPLVSILEDDGSLTADPAAALARFRALGVDRVRYFINWDVIAPDRTQRAQPHFNASNPAGYPPDSWTQPDAIVRASAAEHEPLDVTIGPPPPRWASGSGAPPRRVGYAVQWRPSAIDYGEFVHALGVRYSGHYTPRGAHSPLPRVDFWSIWNEPNYGVNLAPQAVDDGRVTVAPHLYRDLLDAAWTALAATGHTPRTDTILIGETAPRAANAVPGQFNGMLPLRFVEALYCVGPNLRPMRGATASARGCPSTAAGSARFAAVNPALFDASGWADHPYPDAVPPNVAAHLPVGDGYPGDGYADFANLANLETILDRSAAAYGRSTQLPIWSTEFGYNTDPPNTMLGLPPAIAARYLNQAEYLSWINPRIRSYDQYELTDPAGTKDDLFATGLEFSNGRPKPSVYDAYRMPLWLPRTSAGHGSSLLVWGCVRPAPNAARMTRRAQRVAIELAGLGSTSYRTVRWITLTSKQGCYFQSPVVFPHSGTVRLAWSGAGPTLYSRVQTITLR